MSFRSTPDIFFVFLLKSLTTFCLICLWVYYIIRFFCIVCICVHIMCIFYHFMYFAYFVCFSHLIFCYFFITYRFFSQKTHFLQYICLKYTKKSGFSHLFFNQNVPYFLSFQQFFLYFMQKRLLMDTYISTSAKIHHSNLTTI